MKEDLTKKIIGAAIKVHRVLGPGLLESAYQESLYYELGNLNLNVERQKPVPLVYEGVTMDTGYRIDLLIERKIVVEVKSVESLTGIHTAQLLTYLKLLNCRIGLLINFNVLLLKDGIKRIVNGW